MLPPLRQDLTLHPGPADTSGAPTWTLHDPAANKFYQLSWPAFEILSRWPLGDARALLDAVNRETTLTVGEDELEAVVQLLHRHNLLLAWRAEDSARLGRIAGAHRVSKAMWLLKHYLFFRVPLVRPMPMLQRCAPWVEWAFKPRFWWGVGLVALLGLYLVSRRWDEFTHTFASYAGLQGLLGIGLALSLAKVLHELGHAFTAYRYGCRVPTMGVAFLVMWPVLYTDTNEAWKLMRREDRLKIGAAGMLSELALAAFATVAWSFLPDGPLRAGAFMLATSTWLLTLAINASPFMRFDGYFLLADWLNMPNLHDRAFAMARWWLRERLFGFADPAPESFSASRRRFLIVFAILTWLYRLGLFFGIALTVYHLFFKTLGLALLAIELGVFIVMPVVRELLVWRHRRADIHWNAQTRRAVVLLGVLLAVVVIPWGGTIRAPAVLSASQSQSLYAAQPGYVSGGAVQAGQTVAAGQLLVQLVSPELDFRLAAAQAQAQQLRWQMEQQPFATKLREEGDVLRRRWAAAQAEVTGLAEERKRMEVRAPFAGRVVDANLFLADGAWLARGEPLYHIVGQGSELKAEAFIGEQDHAALTAGSSGVFVANLPEFGSVRCAAAQTDQVNVAGLEQRTLASLYGGPIAVTRSQHNGLAPTTAIFRVRLSHCDSLPLSRELPGTVLLARQRHSLAGDAWTALLGLMQRERGL
ncbi:HlyD family efflux transporter periplasmic adaptor subunit [Cupriavidus basilensis]|uniref:HlyD family efflux transporter periplasmic adaptor subunit n=1 Tax=Cupriavidus basilensis TaxID=68895 RepID=UPI002848DAD1|nr:HlyD family efflux transporter periplasmic adaptor subunit [Cupriavidus basilensis]MDR3383537.1 HlyD family efflux transporter periplasmic adaptor subunit [Cupriavidus basilensis]